MNKILYIVLLACFGANSVSAQRAAEKKTVKFDSQMKEMLKEDTEPMFKQTQVPDAYKTESIVVLAQKFRLKFTGSSSMQSSLTYVHTRMLLNDIAALEEFSEFTFDEPNSSNAIQVNIIKKDGKVENVNLEEAVSDEKKINVSRYRFNFSESKKKIALKNLEVGDILEYVGLFENWQSSFNYEATYYFAPEYSTVSSKIMYEIQSNVFLVANKSINDAPKFVESKDKGFTVYTVKDTMRKRYEEELEDIDALTEPHFKMHIIGENIKRFYEFKYDESKAKHKVTEEDLKNKVWKQVNTSMVAHTEYYLDYIEQYGYNQSDEEFIRTYFYFLRDRIFTYSATFDENPESQGLNLMNLMIRAANKRKIPYDVILFQDRNDGRFDDVLFESELYWGVEFKTTDQDIGIYSFHHFAHPNEIPSGYEGTTAYRFSIGSSLRKTTVAKYDVPVTPPEHNLFQITTTAEFANGFDTVKLNRQVVKKGIYRNTTKFDLNNRFDNFNRYLKQIKEENLIKNDDLRYYFINNRSYVNYDKNFIDSEELRCREVFKQNQYDRLKKYFEKSHQTERYSLLKYNSYKVVSDSREPAQNWVEWTEELSIGDIAHQVNEKTLVIDIGAVFGGMYQINNDKNREVRTKPFILGLNKTYVCDLSFKVPAGYTVKDFSHLNQTFENNIGTFSTVATLNGNVLRIVLTKVYKANTYSKEDWPAYIKFLDSAAGFNQIKIVLEK